MRRLLFVLFAATLVALGLVILPAQAANLIIDVGHNGTVGNCGSNDPNVGPYDYRPATLQAQPGDSVTFRNPQVHDNGCPAAAHPTQCRGNQSKGECPFGTEQMDTGASFTVNLPKEGTFKYVCLVHPYMVGTIVVGDGDPNNAPSPEPTQTTPAPQPSPTQTTPAPQPSPTQTTPAPQPSPTATAEPSPEPTQTETEAPADDETVEPTEEPTADATDEASPEPSEDPTDDPVASDDPTDEASPGTVAIDDPDGGSGGRSGLILVAVGLLGVAGLGTAAASGALGSRP